MRPPLSLERMRWSEGAADVAYALKPKDGRPGGQQHLDPLDFLARLIAHVPEPRLHLAHYCGWYSNVSRGRRRKGPTDQHDVVADVVRYGKARPGLVWQGIRKGFRLGMVKQGSVR
jgi:hypothetical protein